jgi:hypothetical protein
MLERAVLPCSGIELREHVSLVPRAEPPQTG